MPGLLTSLRRVEVHACRLRRKLARGGGTSIETVRGAGYRVTGIR